MNQGSIGNPGSTASHAESRNVEKYQEYIFGRCYWKCRALQEKVMITLREKLCRSQHDQRTALRTDGKERHLIALQTSNVSREQWATQMRLKNLNRFSILIELAYLQLDDQCGFRFFLF